MAGILDGIRTDAGTNGNGNGNGNGQKQVAAMLVRLTNVVLLAGMALVSFFLQQAYSDLRSVYATQLVLTEQVHALQLESARLSARVDAQDTRWSAFWEKYGGNINGQAKRKANGD